MGNIFINIFAYVHLTLLDIDESPNLVSTLYLPAVPQVALQVT